MAKHSFKIISDITRKAICFFYRNEELEFHKIKNVKSFSKYVNTVRLNSRSSSPQYYCGDLLI